MQFKSTRVAASLALAFGIVVSSTSHAARPEAVPDAAQAITPAWTPPGVMNKPMTVVVQLSGQTVAEQQGAAGRKLARADKDRIKAALRAQQDALRPNIQAVGGTVLGTYQSAYNGIKVRISRGQVAALVSLPGVVTVRPLQLHYRENLNGVPLIGAPTAWGAPASLHGEGVKIAIIDTGIDYTHAMFGGPGTAAAYVAAHTHETDPADPALFGPAAPRVKGGIDLVGDSYNPDDSDPKVFQPVPHPDPNPLDCNGHGSHVAGTAAGSGVTSSGQTYTGPYNANTLSTTNFNIGPGVAPKADLYAVRVFGCEGPTDVVVDALEWAVDNDMDVVNMSLGSSFGSADDPSAVASTNAAKAGIVVVASSGNSGANQYITGSPATADGAISVAASDPVPTFPGVHISFTSGGVARTIDGINANNFAFSGPVTYDIKVVKDNPATTSRDESLGCSVADFGGPLPPNTIAVVNRGTCARVAKAIFGQQAGAAAVVMVNNATGFPPLEGPITVNPDDGVPFTVTIPFIGVKGLPTTSTSDGGRLRAATGPATVTPAILANPTFKAFADFSSSGPRTGDGALKPDVTAPGVSIVSTGVGTGNGPATLSGTSMAAPHTTGVAALTRQAHPGWRVEDLKSAIMHTAQPAQVANYRTSRGGVGLVQPVSSTATQVVARTSGGKWGGALNFGVAEFRNPYSRTLDITLRNLGDAAAGFNVAQKNVQGSTHSVALSSSTVSVPAGGEAVVSVTLNLAPGAVAPIGGSILGYREVAGVIEFSPQSASDNAGVFLRVPYLLVPRVEADVSTTLGRFSAGTATATVTNKNGAITGSADFYAWGLFAPRIGGQSNQTADIRAVGVQSFPSDGVMVFALNTYERWSNPSSNEFDIYVDVDGDGKPDYVVIAADDGAVNTGTTNGRLGSFVLDLKSGAVTEAFIVQAPTDGSTALIPVLFSQLCNSGSPCLGSRLAYEVVGFDLLNGGSKAVPGVAKFNVSSSSVSTGDFVSVAPGATGTSTVTVNSTEAAQTPALGLMVVTLDNKSGADEAQLIPLK